MKDNYYFDKFVALLKEAFTFKRYKAIHLALAIIFGVLLIPVGLVFLSLAFCGLVTSFIFSIFNQPAKYLHSIVSKEGQSVKHATQAVLYFVCWPTIIFLYTLCAFMTICINFIYALTSIFGYAWTLAGYKFHVFLYTEKIEKDIVASPKVEDYFKQTFDTYEEEKSAPAPEVHEEVEEEPKKEVKEEVKENPFVTRDNSTVYFAEEEKKDEDNKKEDDDLLF